MNTAYKRTSSTLTIEKRAERQPKQGQETAA